MRQHVTIINKQLELAPLSAAAALGSFQLLSQGCGSASPRDSGGTPGVPSSRRGWSRWFRAQRLRILEIWGLFLNSTRSLG